jgi:hypothetical protein
MLNFEVAVTMYDSSIALQLDEQFTDDLQWATAVLPEHRERQSAWRILGENICRLFAPVL